MKRGTHSGVFGDIDGKVLRTLELWVILVNICVFFRVHLKVKYTEMNGLLMPS